MHVTCQRTWWGWIALGLASCALPAVAEEKLFDPSTWGERFRKPKQTPVAAVQMTEQERAAQAELIRRAQAREAVLKGTIGEVASIEMLPGLTVEGYGVVVGLGTNGSAEVPAKLREQLIAEMKKNLDLRDAESGKLVVNPESFLDSKDTAVVRVRGTIGSGAAKGDTFDVDVQALPETQTLSLEGGWLYTTDLIVRRNGADSRPLATASGAVFVSPFIRPPGYSNREGFTRREPRLRRGKVLGGGTVVQGRPLRLELRSPSFKMAASVRERINTRFPNDPPVADAVSPSYINITVPDEWKDRREQFLAILTRLYLRTDAVYLQRQVQTLVDVMQQADPPADDIALIWEGLGRGVIPDLQKLYAHSNEQAAFFAAVAGARAGDRQALDVLVTHAKNPQSRYHERAASELANVHDQLMEDAAEVLYQLACLPDMRVRLKAYEALTRLPGGHPQLTTVKVAGAGFTLDVLQIPENSPPLIYAWTTGQQRLAVFGAQLKVNRPLFYLSPDELVTLDADYNGLLRVTRRVDDRVITVPNAPADVIGLIHFLGSTPRARDPERELTPDNIYGVRVSYSQILTMLMQMCGMAEPDSLNTRRLAARPGAEGAAAPELDALRRHIPARFVLQKASPLDIVGAAAIQGPRPEKDTDPGAAVDDEPLDAPFESDAEPDGEPGDRGADVDKPDAGH